jgi:hypothetical protein
MIRTFKLTLSLWRAAQGHVSFFGCWQAARAFQKYCKDNGLAS